jgi:hypothetical protein
MPHDLTCNITVRRSASGTSPATGGHLREVVSDLPQFTGQLFKGALLVVHPVADLFG